MRCAVGGAKQKTERLPIENRSLTQIPGMDHIDSEYYEVSRVSDPDALSIDSIHKTVFKR